MGREADCMAYVCGQRVSGKAQLETDEIIFRGLKDIKVARFSATHTAHKFVIPVSAR